MATQPLGTAVAGDGIQGDDIQASIDALRALANGLDDVNTDDMTVADMQKIGQVQSQLRDLAGSLVDKQIDLLAGQAKVTAEHINAAVKAAKDVVESIAEIKAKLAKVGALLDFFAAVVTGNGKAIVEAAITLKKKLA